MRYNFKTQGVGWFLRKLAVRLILGRTLYKYWIEDVLKTVEEREQAIRDLVSSMRGVVIARGDMIDR